MRPPSVLYLFLLILLYQRSVAQVQLILSSGDDPAAVKKLNYRKKHSTTAEALAESQNLVLFLQSRGHLLAEIDSSRIDSPSVFVSIRAGQIFQTARLGRGNLHPQVASRLGISEKLFVKKPFRYTEVVKTLEKIIRYYENNGFPFAVVNLDSVEIQDNSLSAVLNVQTNKFFKIDSLKIIGTARVNKRFLEKYLGVREGMAYNEEAIAGVSQWLRQLPFLIEKQEQRVQLTDRTNKLILFLDKKEASQFDGIIGLLPDVNTGKTVVTGDVKLKVVNGVFRNGETFDLEWRRLQTQTQDFNGRLIYPYLFGTPVGTDYGIKIYRRDTTFIDVLNNLGLQYYFSGLNHFRIFYKQRNTNLISTSGLEFATSLPEFADITTRSYGIGFLIEDLDYRFNPRKGISLQSNVQTGDRNIRQNPRVNPLAYEDLLLRSTQYQFDATFNFFVPIVRQHVIRIGIQSASIFGNSTIFKNELFRIGGLKTLRGFDEESIFASTFVIPTIEYRFLFARNSNLLLFAEGAWYENNSNRQYISDTPLSLGAGVNFETRAGILSINYALGNQFGNGFDARNGKIHFGLTALF